MAVCRPKRSGFLGDEQYNYSDIIGWKGGHLQQHRESKPKGEKKTGAGRLFGEKEEKEEKKTGGEL